MASIHQWVQGGTWYVSYRQKGKLTHRSLATTSKRKARELKREVELLLEEGSVAEVVITDQPKSQTRTPSIEECWEPFVAWAQAHRACSTVSEYTMWFLQFVEHSGIVRLGDTTRSDVESFKAKLLRQGKGKPRGVGLDKVSINNALKTLKSIWNHARKLDLYSGKNPFREVESFKLPQRPEREYLDGDQINRLMDAARQYADEKYVKPR